MVYRGQHFQPLTESLTARLAGRVGYGAAYGGTSTLPFFESFYAGGFGSVRGYRDNTLGPKASSTGRNSGRWNSVGGNLLAEGTIEVLFPLPFIKDQRALRSSLFFDFGNVFDTSCADGGALDSSGKQIYQCSKLSLSELRYSMGVGLTWITPLGPLTFSLAKALNKKERDEEQVFQFSLGVPF